MEATGYALRRTPNGPSAFSIPDSGNLRVSVRPKRVHVGGGGFADNGHLRYYVSPVRCGGKAKDEKRRAKLVSDLSRDLSALMTMGVGCEEGEGVVGVAPNKMTISQAAEALMAQLEQVRAKEKDTKKMKKKKEKAMKKMKKEEKAMKKMKDCDESSSSSESSESSDSDCEDEVVDMRSTSRICAPADVEPASPATLPCSAEKGTNFLNAEYKTVAMYSSLQCAAECSSKVSVATATNPKSNMVDAAATAVAATAAIPMERIEVCMGGKCKKSGALQLKEEFEKLVGVEGAVVGCKCMGKCKEGPNIRVLNNLNQDETSTAQARNPLCIGVGLEDVGTIVANYFGKNDLGLLAA